VDTLNDVVTALRAARALLDIRQDELARRAGVSRKMIGRIEEGGKKIPFDTIQKVQSALEKDGVVFFPSTAAHGTGIALRK